MDQDATWHEGRSQPRRLCVRWGPCPLPTKGREPPSQFSVHFYCGQTAGCIKMPLGMELGVSQEDFGLDGDPAPSQKGGPGRGQSPPIFGPWLLCPNGWMDQDGTWHGGRLWSSPHCARWGHSSPPQNRGQSPPPKKIPAHLYCGQTAGCIKMPLGTEVGLDRPMRHCVRCGASYPRRRAHPPNPILSIVAKWLDG